MNVPNDPIGFSLNLFGVNAASPALVTDADFDNFDNTFYYEMVDLGEYRMILNCMGNFTQTDESIADRSQSWGGMATRYQGRADKLESLYAARLKTPQYTLDFTTIRTGITPDPGWFFGYGNW